MTFCRHCQYHKPTKLGSSLSCKSRRKRVEDLHRSRRFLQMVNLVMPGDLRVTSVASSSCVAPYQIWQEQIYDRRSALYYSDTGLCRIKNHTLLLSSMSKWTDAMTILIAETTSLGLKNNTGLPMAYIIEARKSSRHK